MANLGRAHYGVLINSYKAPLALNLEVKCQGRTRSRLTTGAPPQTRESWR